MVVGAGLAGLVAARAIARSRLATVDVFECDVRAGGKAASWRLDGGYLVERGLHVCFAHYQELLHLLSELGVDGRISWLPPRISFVGQDGRTADLHFPRWLPAPLASAWALAGFKAVPLVDRLRATKGAAQALLAPSDRRARYETETFAQWARGHGVTEALRQCLFDPLVEGLTFLSSSEVSARAVLDYIHVIGRNAKSFRMGLFMGGTGDVVVEPLVQDLVRLSGRLCLGCPVSGLRVQGNRCVGVVTADGRMVHADLVILAVPSHALPRLLPSQILRLPGLTAASRLASVSVASAILEFDRLLPGPIGLRLTPGAVFNTWADMASLWCDAGTPSRSILQFVVLPRADIALDDDHKVLDRVHADLCRVWPPAREARILRATLTRTDPAFHAAVPGAEACRPHVETGLNGLLLAGDHVRTGHGPNMESAVAAGRRAAERGLAWLM